MKKYADNFTKDLIISALGFFIFGLVLLLNPNGAEVLICYIAGILIAIIGITKIIGYVRTSVEDSDMRPNLVLGILLIVVGVLVAILHSFIFSIIAFIFGILLFLDSLVKIQHALDLKRLNYDKWWINLIFALIICFAGILIIIDPFSGKETLMQFLGVVLILVGLIDLWSILLVSSKIKGVKKEKVAKEEAQATKDCEEAHAKKEESTSETGTIIDAEVVNGHVVEEENKTK